MASPDATHVIAAGGTHAYATTDGPGTPVAAGLAVRLLDSAGPWARVRFENGSEYWVPADALAPLPPAPTSPTGPPRVAPTVTAPTGPPHFEAPATAAAPTGPPRVEVPATTAAPTGPPRVAATAAGPPTAAPAPAGPPRVASGGTNALPLIGVCVVLALLLTGVVVVVTRDSGPSVDATSSTTVPGIGGGIDDGGFPTTTSGGGGGGGGGTESQRTGPVPESLQSWDPSEDRARVEAHLGMPVAFYRNFGSLGADDEPIVDTYIYPDSEARFVFADGVYLTVEEGPTAPPPDAGGIPDGVTADDFTAGMSPDDVEEKLGDTQATFVFGEDTSGMVEQTFESGQAFFYDDALVWVYVGAIGEVEEVNEGAKKAAEQATTTFPVNEFTSNIAGASSGKGSPVGLAPIAGNTGVASERAALFGAGDSIAAAAAGGGFLSWLYSLVKRGKEVKDTAGMVDTARMHAELLTAKTFIDDQLARTKERISAGGLSDVEKHQLEQFIAKATALGGEIERVEQALPKGSVAIDQFLPWFSPSTADTTDFKALYDDLVKRLGGVDRLDEKAKRFLERAQVDWKLMGADERRSLLVSLFQALVYKNCGAAPVDGKVDDWQFCVNRQLNDLRRTDFPPATTIECLDALKGARERIEKGQRIRGQTSEIPQTVRSCPVPGWQSQPPVEDIGVFTADIDIVVGTQTQVENTPTCSYVGWGLDCTVMVGEAAPVTMRLGPFKTEGEAVKAMCDAIIPGSEFTVPNVAGGRRVDAAFGKRLSVDNAPSCTR